jgi:hypothetical protein
VTVRDRRSAGVWLHSTELDGRRWLALECRDTSLSTVFEALADEVHRSVAEVPAAGEAVRRPGQAGALAAPAVPGPSGRISREVEIGLHGELTS